MSQTETSEAEAIDPEREPRPRTLEHTPEEDPAVSPTEGHHGPTHTPPVPNVTRHAAPDRPRCGNAAAESSWPRSARSVTGCSAG